MIDALFQRDVLKYAATATASGRLVNAEGSLTFDNPLCGDKITVYANFSKDRIVDFSHETRACVLCQASASILGEHCCGESQKQLGLVCDTLKRGLKEKKFSTQQWPHKKWNVLEIFQPVSDYHNRHRCVLLPFEAVLKLLEKQSG